MSKDKVWHKQFGSETSGHDVFGTHVTKDGDWEVDHVYPEAHDGSNHLDNLQVLAAENNTAKGDHLEGEVNGKKFKVEEVSTDDHHKKVGKMTVH